MNLKQVLRKQIRSNLEKIGVHSLLGWEVDGIKVYVISYPKSGRTWLRTLLGKSLCDYYKIDENLLLETHLLSLRAKVLPTLFSHGMSGKELWHELSKDKSKYKSKKIVFLVRQPHDVMVSHYFQVKNRRQRFNGSISEFIRDEKLGVKKLLNFNKIWYENQHNVEDFLLIRYEDLHKDAISCLSNLLQFVSAKDVPIPVVEKAVEFCRFENMKKKEASNEFNDKRLSAANPENENSYKVRRGKVGGYVDYLSQEDIEYIDANMADFAPCFY